MKEKFKKAAERRANIQSQESSLEDVYNDITDNGDINYMSIGSYENFKHRYEGFKENLKKKLPNFTFEELLKIYQHFPVIREEVYGFYNHDIFLDVLKLETKIKS